MLIKLSSTCAVSADHIKSIKIMGGREKIEVEMVCGRVYFVDGDYRKSIYDKFEELTSAVNRALEQEQPQ